MSAPPAAEFQEVLDDRRGGPCTLGRLMKTCSAVKSKRIQFCLAEARRMYARRHLQMCSSLATHSDSKAQRLTVRCAATRSTDISGTRRGSFGH
eukprot:8883739-Pyramimonas_sp.AAC.1